MVSPSRVTSFAVTLIPVVPAAGVTRAPIRVSGLFTVAPVAYEQPVRLITPPDAAPSILDWSEPEQSPTGTGVGVGAGVAVAVRRTSAIPDRPR